MTVLHLLNGLRNSIDLVIQRFLPFHLAHHAIRVLSIHQMSLVLILVPNCISFWLQFFTRLNLALWLCKLKLDYNRARVFLLAWLTLYLLLFWVRKKHDQTDTNSSAWLQLVGNKFACWKSSTCSFCSWWFLNASSLVCSANFVTGMAWWQWSWAEVNHSPRM